MKLDCLVILETMWGGRGAAPNFFRISKANFTGRRLYGWLDPYRFLVTNACPELVAHATHHGRPDCVRLARNLASMEARLLLVCGRVAQQAFIECEYRPRGHVLFARHPAARTWTREQLALARTQIQEKLNGS